MKLITALAAAGILSFLTVVTPANAQKDAACTEKCNRDNLAAGAGYQSVPGKLPSRQGEWKGKVTGKRPSMFFAGSMAPGLK